MIRRDYRLLGEDGRRAVENGLDAAEWYHTEVPRKQMKALMARSDSPAIRDTLLLFGLMAAFAGLGIWLWPSWVSAPFWLAYGVLYGSAMDSRWHECGHGTAFRTAWMNRAMYEIASFMMMRNSATWRWTHARHHTNTYIVGLDPEINIMRPPALARIVLNLVGIPDAIVYFRTNLRNALGGTDAAERSFIPESEWPKVARVARIHLGIYAATGIAAVWLHSWLPLLLIGLPRFYGSWHHIVTGLLQHGGLSDNVPDHRLNSRTVLMNPVSRFIYWNMNYHVEHHMFPMVPYHALPALHEAIRHDLPAPNRSMAEGFAQMWPILRRQLRGEDVVLDRQLPPTARPYRHEFHATPPAFGQPTPAE